MNQGSDVTMRNLLRAVRSEKKSGLDYQVDDDFDGVDSTAEGPKIDEQISAAFQQNCLRDVMEHISPEKLSRLGEEKWQNMSPEQLAEALRQMDESVGEQEAEKSYRQEQLAQYQQLAETPEDVYTYLERYDIPNSMVNVMAASEMLRKPNRMMERLFQQDHVSKDSMTEIAEMKEQVLEQFSKALENPSDLADSDADRRFCHRRFFKNRKRKKEKGSCGYFSGWRKGRKDYGIFSGKIRPYFWNNCDRQRRDRKADRRTSAGDAGCHAGTGRYPCCIYTGSFFVAV